MYKGGKYLAQLNSMETGERRKVYLAQLNSLETGERRKYLAQLNSLETGMISFITQRTNVFFSFNQGCRVCFSIVRLYLSYQVGAFHELTET